MLFSSNALVEELKVISQSDKKKLEDFSVVVEKLQDVKESYMHKIAVLEKELIEVGFHY